MDAPILRFDRQSLPQPHVLPGLPQVSLEVTRGRVRERKRRIPGRVFLIGSASDCDLVLGDLQFPEAYAYVFVDGQEVSIRRLGAGPVLVVCGDQVESSELFHGDLIEMGPFELRVVIDLPPRRARHDEGPAALRLAELPDASETLDAVDEVRSLLADIHKALAEDAARALPYHHADEPAPGVRQPDRPLRAIA